MISHPNKPLKEHLQNVKNMGLMVFDTNNINLVDKDVILKTFANVLFYHDAGKATDYFQEYIQGNDIEKYKKSPYKELKSHSLLSALVFLYVNEKQVNNFKLSMMGFLLIKSHHGDLNDFKKELFSRDKLDLTMQQLNKFNFDYFGIDKADCINYVNSLYTQSYVTNSIKISKIIRELTLYDYMLTGYMFSILVSADKGEAIYHSSKTDFGSLLTIKSNKALINKNIVDEYKKIKYKESKSEIDLKRENAYIEIEQNLLANQEDRIFSITLPTGMGKTLASFNAAIKLRNREKDMHKIIYVLPFTSVIDQNYKIIEDILKPIDNSVLLKHHHLSEKVYKKFEDELDDNISEYLIENWDSEVIISTFHQLFYSIISNKNSNLKKYCNIANSIIVLDEVQSIPYKYWKLVNNTLKMLCQNFNCYVIFLTATMPLIFKEKDKEIVELVANKEFYFGSLNRVSLDILNIKNPMDIDDFCNYAVEEVFENPKDSFLFVMNTINSSQMLYEALKKEFSEYKIIYLSSNIIPIHRLARIEEIKRLNSKKEKLIVVSTQIVEAGVDISLDRVYRDLAPLDCINQTCGRCNRNNSSDKMGVVKIFSISQNSKLLSTFVYKGQILSDATKNALCSFGDVIYEKDFLKLSTSYFENIERAKSDDCSNYLIENLSKLKYSEVFDNESKYKFELIDKSYKTIDLFIEIDQQAVDIWGKYQNILNSNIDRYELKRQLNKIRHDLYSYVVSVPEKYYSRATEGLNYINIQSLKFIYNKELGFIREDKQDNYFL